MTAFRPVPATGFMPLAAVFDLDHTLIAGDATIGWTEYLYERGVVTDPVFREINERMKASYHAGTLDIAAWLREAVPAYSGLDEAERNLGGFDTKAREYWGIGPIRSERRTNLGDSSRRGSNTSAILHPTDEAPCRRRSGSAKRTDRISKDRLTMMFKKVFAAAASALAIAAFAGNAMARDTLRVGTEPTFAPFEFLDTKTQEFSGFDIDLIKAVADKAGYDVKVMNMGFDALIPALSAGTIDVIASGISITEERQKKVDFTSPYYQSGLSYLVRKADAEKIKTFADLKGKTLAVQIGTTGAAYAKNVEGARVSAFNTTSEAFMDLNVKNADAVVLDRPVLAYFLKTKPRVAKNLQLSTEIADAEHFGFAVKKGNAELLQKLNAALEELKKSGEFAKIEDKWFAK